MKTTKYRVFTLTGIIFLLLSITLFSSSEKLTVRVWILSILSIFFFLLTKEKSKSEDGIVEDLISEFVKTPTQNIYVYDDGKFVKSVFDNNKIVEIKKSYSGEYIFLINNHLIDAKQSFILKLFNILKKGAYQEK